MPWGVRGRWSVDVNADLATCLTCLILSAGNG